MLSIRGWGGLFSGCCENKIVPPITQTAANWYNAVRGRDAMVDIQSRRSGFCLSIVSEAATLRAELIQIVSEIEISFT
jgi:hypothetical protein